MARYFFECLYCGKTWSDNFYYIPKGHMTCPICKDTNVKIKKHAAIDYYIDKIEIDDDESKP